MNTYNSRPPGVWADTTLRREAPEFAPSPTPAQGTASTSSAPAPPPPCSPTPVLEPTQNADAPELVPEQETKKETEEDNADRFSGIICTCGAMAFPPGSNDICVGTVEADHPESED